MLLATAPVARSILAGTLQELLRDTRYATDGVPQWLPALRSAPPTEVLRRNLFRL